MFSTDQAPDLAVLASEVRMVNWLTFKVAISDLTVQMDALHIYAAVALQLAAAFLFRRSLGSWLPWLAVLVPELLNEYMDTFWGETNSPEPWQETGAVHDILNTMVLPTVLLLLVRNAPSLFGWSRSDAAGDAE